MEQDSTIINRCVKYFAAIIWWMFLAALSVQSAVRTLYFIYWADLLSVLLQGAGQALGNLKSEISERGPGD